MPEKRPAPRRGPTGKPGPARRKSGATRKSKTIRPSAPVIPEQAKWERRELIKQVVYVVIILAAVYFLYGQAKVRMAIGKSNSAMKLLGNKETEKAIGMLEEALAAVDRRGELGKEISNNLGMAYLRRGDEFEKDNQPAEALKYYLKAIDYSSNLANNGETHTKAAYCYFRTGDKSSAKAYADMALEKNPNNGMAKTLANNLKIK